MFNFRYGEWVEVVDDDFIIQIFVVVCCGVVGENKSCFGVFFYGFGLQVVFCGFGGVFGLKKLKVISVIGIGGVKIVDFKVFMDICLWYRQFQWNVDNL